MWRAVVLRVLDRNPYRVRAAGDVRSWIRELVRGVFITLTVLLFPF